jgi:threonine/homoserine/homoserine lactone efflux protein
VWAAFGSALRGYLAVPVRRRVFNAVMAGLLVVTAAAMLAGSG